MENFEGWQVVLGIVVGGSFAILITLLVVAARREFKWLRKDGYAGGRRGEQWSEDYRKQYRAGTPPEKHTLNKRDAQIARLSGNVCPPHDPEYDKSVNETYCSKCLERLPNEPGEN